MIALAIRPAPKIVNQPMPFAGMRGKQAIRRLVPQMQIGNFLVANFSREAHYKGNQEVADMSNTIEKSIEMNAPIERVWKALTDYREFGEWFRVKIEAPFEPGKPSRGHITYPGYEHLAWEADIKEMEEPTFFSFTWHPYAIDPAVDYSHEVPTLVEFRLQATATGTKLTVIESGFDAIPKHRMPEAFRMNEGGWAEQVKNIKTYVES
jgi:uncharacterized protein YndB with AHSA1/START domain